MTEAQNIDYSTGSKRPNRSSILAKCTAPFVAKQRSQVEQEIRLDEPFRQYAPGDSVKGAIHLTFAKPSRITHLVVRLHGFVKVYNRAKLPGEETSYEEHLLSSNGGGRRGTEYFGNGYARLFEDEEVLCGEGRVLGRYEFRFDMVLPPNNMPSSIDFEHGTISYLISSTVTRPTAITPTSVQHFKLHVQEIIDVASIQKPKPVLLSLETSHNKGKSKAGSIKNSMVPTTNRTSVSSSRESTIGLPTPQAHNPQNIEEPPPSPAPSEISSTIATSSSTSSNPISSAEPSSLTLNKSVGDVTTISDLDTISAKTEVLQGGCLAGDQLPMKITIKHNKAVKNMQGIIITLYRQGRIDTHPAIPLGPFRKGEKRRYEDCYPKSRTGLGGLSLSSAGSSRSFRQDLAQIVVPLIIDPHSFTAVINTNIEAPPHLFPSITDVPGAMVNFRYFVEIVVDLRGKLSGQDRLRPHLSMTNAPQHGYGDPKVSRWEDSDGVNYHSAPAFNYLITDHLRRTRGIISTKTEITVGTRDSARKRGKQSWDRPRQSATTSLRNSVDLGREEEPYLNDGNEHEETVLEVRGRRQLPNNNGPRQPIMIPLPEPEEELDEKARMIRAEERLLPSEPPQDDDQPLASTAPLPSAPPAIDEEDFIHRYALNAPAPAYDGPPGNTPHSGNSNTVAGQDDKQELERQRLLALASSPDDDNNEAGVVGATPRAVAPSAPVLYQDDIFSINDPRIPESSPADFADDRVTLEDTSTRLEPPVPPAEDGVSQDHHELEEQSLLGDHGMHDKHDGNDTHEQESNDDVATLDDNLPAYRR